jgi:class 3 adenylate cyclase/tetratricopeptide (TPR) repeat protein
MNIQTLSRYIPADRFQALARGFALPDRMFGATLFVDISGFTPLTNALVQELGSQRGADELSRQLNLIYTDLIIELERQGGSVIGFSGDAMTCWFDVDDGARAIVAALAMQQAMRRFAAVTTPAGTIVSLAIKCAVAVGPVRRFIVGDPDYQLIDTIAGATLERMVAAEHHAEKGEVIATTDVVDALGDQLAVSEWRTDHQSGARFAVVHAFRGSVAERRWSAPADGTLAEAELARWLVPSVYARLKAGQEQFLAELRPVVCMFVSFGGIDYDADDSANARLDAYIRWVQAVIRRYEGTFLQLTIGDKGSYFYCSFGAPVAHEDDARRAMLAGLTLQVLPPELAYIQQVQIGISMGRTYTGAYGGSTRITYGVLGNEVNMAARLMQAAPSGQVYVSEAAQQPVQSSFLWEALPPLFVKGRSEPLTVYRLAGTRGRLAALPQSLFYGLPMVGRHTELAQIGEAIDRALAGQGQVVAITAEAGMGKSRLVGEAVRMAHDRQIDIFNGECQSYGANNSYLVWEEIWESFFDINPSDPPEQQIRTLEQQLSAVDPSLLPRLPLLGVPLSLAIPDTDLTRTLDARLRKASLESLLVACLRHRARNHPLMIVLEDAHWIDPLSHDLFEVIGQAIFDLPVIVLIAFRPPENELQFPQTARLQNCTTIQLGELAEGEAIEFIANKLIHLNMPADWPADVMTQIVARTQGNPFYIEELLNYLQSRSVILRTTGDLEQLDLPNSLYSLILSRIDQLNESQKTTLKVASVIGRVFRAAWLWGAHPALGEPERIINDLSSLHRMELMLVDQPEPESVYLFKHILTHGVAYESLPFSTRAWLHEQVGAYIEDAYQQSINQWVNLLAYHYDLSTNEGKKRAYLHRAADAARAAYANPAAISYYQRLLPLVPPAEQAPLFYHLGQVHELVGNWADAETTYQQALALAEEQADRVIAVESRRAIGWLLRKQGRYAEALEWLDRARQGYQELDDIPGYVQALSDIGEVYRVQGQFAAAAQAYDESLARSAGFDADDARAAARANVLKGAGTLGAQQGDYTTARTRYEESLSIQRDRDDKPSIATLLNNLSIVAGFQGDNVAARRLNEESLLLFREIGDQWSIGQSLNNLGMVASDQQDYATARVFLEESLAVRRGLGDTWGIANSLSSLGSVLIQLGDYDAARTAMIESLQINQELDDRTYIAYLIEDFAFLAAVRGQNERALSLAGAAAALRDEIGAPLPPAEQETLDARLAPARTALGARADDTLQRGRTLTFEASLALAMSDDERAA